MTKKKKKVIRFLVQKKVHPSRENPGYAHDDDAVEQEHIRHCRACSSPLLPRSFSALTSVCHNTKFVNDPLRHVKPAAVQLTMTDCREATVKFPCAAENTRSVEDTLQRVYHGLWGSAPANM